MLLTDSIDAAPHSQAAHTTSSLWQLGWNQLTNPDNFANNVLWVAGIIAAWFIARYYYVKSQRVRKPSWYRTNNNLIRDRGSLLPDLTVLYQDQAVDNLSITTITFWNAGGETIRKEDVPSTRPFCVVSTDQVSRILGAHLVGWNAKGIELAVALDAATNQVNVDFLYLERNDGAVFQVVHTGQAASAIALQGKALGGKDLTRFNEPELPRGLSVLCIFLVGFVFLYGANQSTQSSQSTLDKYGGPILLGLLLAIILSVWRAVVWYFTTAIKPADRQHSKRYKVGKLVRLLINKPLIPLNLSDIDDLPFRSPTLVQLKQLAELKAFSDAHPPDVPVGSN